jgi:hypothetical protein
MEVLKLVGVQVGGSGEPWTQSTCMNSPGLLQPMAPLWKSMFQTPESALVELQVRPHEELRAAGATQPRSPQPVQ